MFQRKMLLGNKKRFLQIQVKEVKSSIELPKTSYTLIYRTARKGNALINYNWLSRTPQLLWSK